MVSVASILAAGRAKHLALLTETCTVTRVTGHTTDPTTDKHTNVTATIYTGACRVKPFRAGHQAEAGQVPVMQRGYNVEMPWNAAGTVLRGDIITITASDDAWVIGRPLTVTQVNYSGTSTNRDVLVEDLA